MAEEEKKKPEGEPKKKGDPKKDRRGKGDAPKKEQVQVVSSTAEFETPRFYTRYHQEVVPALMKQFGYKNPMQVPRLKKVVINMDLGASTSNPKIIDAAVDELIA